jgi:SET domain-containing protein
MNKAALLNELQHHTYVMLRPSATHGIGVFAIRPIPKGCRDMFSIDTGGWTLLTKEEVAALPHHAKALVENYCLWDETHYYVPDHGFKVMDVSLFLNHANEPNLISINDGEFFEAIRDIEEGEELFIDYGTIVTEE